MSSTVTVKAAPGSGANPPPKLIVTFSRLPGREFGPFDFAGAIRDLQVSALLTPLQARDLVLDALTKGSATTETGEEANLQARIGQALADGDDAGFAELEALNVTQLQRAERGEEPPPAPASSAPGRKFRNGAPMDLEKAEAARLRMQAGGTPSLAWPKNKEFGELTPAQKLAAARRAAAALQAELETAAPAISKILEDGSSVTVQDGEIRRMTSPGQCYRFFSHVPGAACPACGQAAGPRHPNSVIAAGDADQ